MRRLDQSVFVVCWQCSSSVAEVWRHLRRCGHAEMTPRQIVRMAWAMRKLGVRLKHIPRPPLPPERVSVRGLARYARRVIRDRRE